ncbi:hypothetical protein R3P38DRAFT_2786554 [Favolaschia claudopus]|uniref:Uncharacterized protein n=1 Tax=Favolaschia claudopus TaxID=2862362 RepID=A0AAW0ASV1_9AGAR
MVEIPEDERTTTKIIWDARKKVVKQRKSNRFQFRKPIVHGPTPRKRRQWVAPDSSTAENPSLPPNDAEAPVLPLADDDEESPDVMLHRWPGRSIIHDALVPSRLDIGYGAESSSRIEYSPVLD